MKKWVLCVIAMALCATLVCPAFAANDTFVPSISYKDGPDVEKAILDGKTVGDCLTITSIRQATEGNTDIYQNERDLLLDVYAKLSNGSMKLPLEETYVVRELLDVSFKASACRDQGHGHKEKLAEPGTTLSVDFDLGVNQDAKIEVLTYMTDDSGNAGWIKIEGVTNNGDGTLTCVFEDICPVAFCVLDEGKIPPKTGDSIGNQLWLWVTLMGVSAVAIVALTWSRFKYRR